MAHPKASDPLVVAVRQHGRLVGLGPFYIENGLLGRRVLPLGLGVSDYLDVLIDPQANDEAAAALVDHITAQADRWDSWELEEIAPHAAAWALPCCTDLFETVDPQSACPVLALPCAAERLPAMKGRSRDVPDQPLSLPCGPRRAARDSLSRAQEGP